ncbi:WXG100 family type VII secretion target [Kitasatospora sp. NBC_01287]|uniref:WXG100 family type VII secretion target n=1 Tax=Kitasatospora sp. NBC_01287 TaxID=2903573 RepID=UPI002250DF3D|nr:WXG100 family type VII secretion target [Kitasatospora sp. NBC_01287]MCX4748163.1 WXG100 family type VII secretion target [Kitasatospora sp. NBC_01287]
MSDAAGGGFSVHPDEILAAAPQFTSDSENIKAAVANLESTLGRIGSPWGADKQGKAFAAAYTPQHTQLIQSMGVLVQGLASIHLGLEAMAGNHQGADTASAAGLSAKASE